MSEWIKLSEEIPPENNPVLVAYEGSYGKKVLSMAIRHGSQFYSGSSSYSFRNVTHWMTLPEPPE